MKTENAVKDLRIFCQNYFKTSSNLALKWILFWVHTLIWFIILLISLKHFLIYHIQILFYFRSRKHQSHSNFPSPVINDIYRSIIGHHSAGLFHFAAARQVTVVLYLTVLE